MPSILFVMKEIQLKLTKLYISEFFSYIPYNYLYFWFLLHKLWSSHTDSTGTILTTKWPIKLHNYLSSGLDGLGIVLLSPKSIGWVWKTVLGCNSCTQISILHQKCQNFLGYKILRYEQTILIQWSCLISYNFYIRK